MPNQSPLTVSLLELFNGEVMTGDEFLSAYETYLDDAKFELIEGVVHMASPVKLEHGDGDSLLITLLKLYQAYTPGVHVGNNTTVCLAADTVVQPDFFVRVLPECGGHTTRTADGYVGGPPELIVEVSNTSRSLDLNAKRRAYVEHGVREYLVLSLREGRFHWLEPATDRDRPVPDDGIIRITEFPGLWIDSRAVINDEILQAIITVQAGLASPEHAAFVEELARRRASLAKGES